MQQATAIASRDVCPNRRPVLTLVAPPPRAAAAPSRSMPLSLERGQGEHERRSAIVEIWVNARQAWPRIALGRECFVQHCERVLGGAPASSWLAHGAELYLCCACAAGDAAAQQVLQRQYLARLERQMCEAHGDSDLVQEALQRLCIKLLVGQSPKIGRFAARGPLSHWLRAAAKRTLLDVIRARRARRHAEREAPVEASSYDPDLVRFIGNARHAQAFLDGLRDALGALNEPDRALIRHSIMDGSTIDVLGELYSIHRSTASRRLRRIRSQIAAAVRQHMKARHDLLDSDVDELALELCDWLETGVRKLLADLEPPARARAGRNANQRALRTDRLRGVALTG